MTDKPKTAESPDIKHPGQEEANTAFGRTGVQSPVDIGTEQAELAADKERLASLELIQERETDKSSKVSKDRKKEIDALKRKIKSKEEVSIQKRMDAARSRVGEPFDYQLRDGSVVKKKAAYIRNNRMINWKRVDEFITIIKHGEYESEYPIIVANAKAFHRNNPSVIIVDAFGNEIPEAALDDYVVYLDGQHRGRAIILCKLLNSYTGSIPGVVVKDDVKDVAKFLVSINPSGSWSNNQKAEVLALTATDKYRSLCEAISSLVREGFNRSTSSQIMTQSKPLSTRQIDLLLSGKEPKDDIEYNIENGNAFISSCKEAGIPVKYLTKRYFIEGFMAFKTQQDLTFADALDTIKKLPKLSEDKLKAVISKDVFKQMLEDVYNA